MAETPPDWVLIEAAKRCEWPYNKAASDDGLTELRRDYCNSQEYSPRAFRALCDLIAKHEQQPVDPDVEAVKRIIAHYFHCDASFVGKDQRFERAVAQYKIERGNV